MTKASPGPEHKPPEPTGPVRRLLSRLLPWIILLLLFGILFSRVPLQQVLAEFKLMTLSQVIALSALSVVAIIGVSILDGTAMGYGFSTFGVRIRYREIILVRAAMMLLASIATLIGQAGLAALIARKYKVPVGESAGMVMFLFLLEIYGMITLSTMALPVLHITGVCPEAPLNVATLIVVLAWPALILFIIVGRRASNAKILEKIRVAPLFYPLRSLRFKELACLLFLKTLVAGWQMVLGVAAFKIYGLEIPNPEFFTFMPLAIMVSSIPITPARLGTTQWSWVLFLGYAASPAALVAFSLLFQFLLNVARWLVGLLALPFIYRQIKGDGNHGDEIKRAEKLKQTLHP